MPVTFNTTQIKYKDQQGNYVGINGVAERTTNEQIAEIQAAAEAAKETIPPEIDEVWQTIEDMNDNFVKVSETAPHEQVNRIWVKENPDEVMVPTDAELDSVVESIAPDYSDLTYPVTAGTLCTHSRALYKAKVDIESADEWDSTKWDAVDVTGELGRVDGSSDYNNKRIESTLDGIKNVSNSTLLFNWEYGGISNETGETNYDDAIDRCRDVNYYLVSDVESVTNNSDVALYIIFYSYNNGVYTFTHATGVVSGATYTFSSDEYFRVCCRGGYDKSRLISGIAKYKIVKAVQELESEVVAEGKLIKSGIKAITNKIIEEKQETVTAGTGNHVLTLMNPILRDTDFTVYNESTNAAISVSAVKIDGTLEVLTSSIGHGYSETFNVDYDIYGIRNYVSNTDWHIKVEYGNTGKDSIVFYTEDQSDSITPIQKSIARNNIGASSQTDMNQVKQDILVDEVKNIFDTLNLINGYVNWEDGDIKQLSSAKSSNLIPVLEGDIITYSLHAVGGVTAVISCYDSSENYIKESSIKAYGNGTWQNNTGTLVIPSGVSYIRYETKETEYENDSVTRTIHVKIKDYIEHIDKGIIWSGKNWAAFGTSITDTSYIDQEFLMPTGKYVPYLVEMSGMKVVNYGIAGAPFLSNIMNKVKSIDLSSFDLVTIEGAVNDHAMSKPLGTVGDTGDDTFAGTIYQMANYVYSNSNATLIFITDHVGRYVHINPTPAGNDFYGDCSPDKKNSLNLLQIDYINMIIKQCEYFGIPCITAGQDAGINLMTGDMYLVDHIHQTYAGGKQYAQTIWSKLSNIRPRVITV